MKQIFKIGILVFLGFIAFTSSCKKDVFTEEDAYANQEDLELLKDSLATAQAMLDNEFALEMELLRDSLKKAGGIIDYSVIAVLATDASWLSYGEYDKGDNSGKGGAGMDGVTVTVSQYGQILTSTTDASGIATFSDLRIGSVTVNVQKAGYCEVDFIAILPALPDSVYVDAYSLVRQAGTMVPMFSMTEDLSTVSGISTVETDLTNDAPEPAANVKVTATIDVEDSHFIYKYLQMPYIDVSQCCFFCGWEFDYYALIRQIAFHSTVFEATTAADGSFTLQVPSTPDGLPYKLSSDEFAADQSLLQATLNSVPVWGVQTVRTMFGPPSAMTYSSIPINGTELSQVQSAYVTFSAPTGTPDAQPTTVAEATAVLASSGIVSINMKNQGEGYTQAPYVSIPRGSAFNSIQAEGTAILTDGRITSVDITNAGSGYMPYENPTVTFISGIEDTAKATPIFTFSVATIDVTASGSGYTSTPDVTITSSTGSGATAIATTSGYVSSLTLTNTGAGYTDTPVVTLSAPPTPGGTTATVTANMTTFNQVHSVVVPDTADIWSDERLGTLIVGDGSGALTDSADLNLSEGKLSSIDITNGGAGYLTAPTVTITGGGGFGAVAHAVLLADVVDEIVIDEAGQNYSTPPTVSITAAPTGGTNATATSNLVFPILSIDVTSSGNGYTAAGTHVEIETFPGSGIFYDVTVNGIVPVLSMRVSSLTLDEEGDGYTAAPTITITPSNGVVSTDATATAAIQYGVEFITVTDQGGGYELADCDVVIDAPSAGGTQATATATLFNGILSDVILNNPGVGYTAPPNVYLAVSSSGMDPVVQAQMSATVSDGEVTGITVDDPGSGYNYNSWNSGYYSIEITTNKGTAGAQAQANPESGQIDYIQITNPGAGYVVAPKIEIVNTADTATGNGFGSGATATATIVDGRVAEITVTNPGSGYYVTPNVNITVPYSSMTAVGRCIVESDGRIKGVEFTGGYPFTQGFGYDTPPTVTFTASIPGKGSGAEGVAVVNEGRVTNVIMTNHGSGYIGKNNPNTAKASAFLPSASVMATAGKAYVRDVNFGTGKRTIEQ